MEDIAFASSQCPGRVVDILGASGASDPGSNPGRGVVFSGFFTRFIIRGFARTWPDNLIPVLVGSIQPPVQRIQFRRASWGGILLGHYCRIL
jgi:hypothetical protein